MLINNVEDFAHHPALRRLITPTEGGDVTLPLPPGADAAGLTGHAVPALDQHGAGIRREFATAP